MSFQHPFWRSNRMFPLLVMALGGKFSLNDNFQQKINLNKPDNGVFLLAKNSTATIRGLAIISAAHLWLATRLSIKQKPTSHYETRLWMLTQANAYWIVSKTRVASLPNSPPGKLTEARLDSVDWTAAEKLRFTDGCIQASRSFWPGVRIQSDAGLRLVIVWRWK